MNQTHTPQLAPKVQLIGSVAGVEACRLLTEADEIVVGSGITCDLVVMDPLVPRRAFRIVKTRRQAGSTADGRSCWQIEPYPGSRVYVNNTLVRRGTILLGDTVAMGCHRFTFLEGDAAARDQRTNMDVGNLCASLVKPSPTPMGFFRGLPSWRDRRRLYRAVVPGVALLVVLALGLLLRRGDDRLFESSTPIEVTVLGTRTVIPRGSTSTSLSQVKRKTFVEAAPAPAPVPADFQPTDFQSTAQLEGKTIAQKADVEATPVAPTALGRVIEDAGPIVTAEPMLAMPTERMAVSREVSRLSTASTPMRRLAVAEAGATLVAVELGSMQARIDKGAIASSTSMHYATELTRQQQVQPKVNLEGQRGDILAALQPSPVEHTTYRGQSIPVARIPEQLAALTVPGGTGAGGTGAGAGPASGAGGGTAASGVGGGPGAGGARGIILDGEVTDAEASVSFKTGRFRIHGPGTPPEANPPTYCFVAKTQVNGKDHLYVSFVCTDPDLNALVLDHNTGDYQICNDDSIEIFIDINSDRNDYHQILVNARGNICSLYCPDGEAGITGRGQQWNSGAIVKTTINRQAGRWVCEVLIPYDHFPSVPAKGTKIPVNFCRNFRGQHNKDPNALQNWFAVWDGGNANYHHARLFGLLEWP